MGESKRRKRQDPNYGKPSGVVLQVSYADGYEAFETQRSHTEDSSIRQRCADILADPTVENVIVLKAGTDIEDVKEADILADCNREPGEGKADLSALTSVVAALIDTPMAETFRALK